MDGLGGPPWDEIEAAGSRMSQFVDLTATHAAYRSYFDAGSSQQGEDVYNLFYLAKWLRRHEQRPKAYINDELGGGYAQ